MTLTEFTGVNGRRKTINKQISTMTDGDKCCGEKWSRVRGLGWGVGSFNIDTGWFGEKEHLPEKRPKSLS